MTVKTLHLKLHGHVQGVFCRARIGRIANELHITGWVRNVGSSTVEVHAQGVNLSPFLDRVKNLSFPVRIDEIEEEYIEELPYDKFSITVSV